MLPCGTRAAAARQSSPHCLPAPGYPGTSRRRCYISPVSTRVTLSDVADAVGVSPQTVSRVLNNHPSVRPETRQKVLAAVRALGYEPNLAARSLASGSSGAVGILLTAGLSHGMASTFSALARAARERGGGGSGGRLAPFSPDIGLILRIFSPRRLQLTRPAHSHPGRREMTLA